MIRDILKKNKIALALLVSCGLLGGLMIFGADKASRKDSSVTIRNDVPKEESGEDIFEGERATEKIEEKEGKATNDQSMNPSDDAVEKTESQTAKTVDDGLEIINRLTAWGFDKKDSRKIDTVIIHSSYSKIGNDPYDISNIIRQYKDYGVSAHYLIGRDGSVYRLVAEKDRAYHAGVSSVPDGRTDVNDFSIGIEIIVKETGDKPTADQYTAAKKLVAEIKKRYSIKYVLGHKDIAPERKTDPWGCDLGKIR